jgi:hypothetical protein
MITRSSSEEVREFLTRFLHCDLESETEPYYFKAEAKELLEKLEFMSNINAELVQVTSLWDINLEDGRTFTAETSKDMYEGGETSVSIWDDNGKLVKEDSELYSEILAIVTKADAAE